ncbi:DNA ligase [Rhodococcus jostii]|uniref:ATP dependent DNA ligase n=1 Tax=Rhodococcus jostii TaxID=132919 RepID=UPI003084364F
MDPGGGLIVDGEIVAPAADGGRPRFDLIQSRTLIQRPPASPQRAAPVAFYIFDLLTHRGAPILQRPYLERRQLLADLDLAPGGESLQVPPHWVDVDGDTKLEEADELGLEGIVTNKMTAPYQPGRRSPDWVKTPLRNSAEVIVGGWEATSHGGLRSLIVGAHAHQIGLVYVGHVDSGFTEAHRRRTLTMLRPLERPTSPFDTHVPDELAAHARWVEPVLVGTVEYREFTPDRRLRHPSWKGFRAGIAPRWVTIEELP